MNIFSLQQLLPKYTIEIDEISNCVQLKIDGQFRCYTYKFVEDHIDKIKNVHDYLEIKLIYGYIL